MSGFDLMKKRLEHSGGYPNGRNVKGKLLSFHSALMDSYQAELITFKDQQWHCLINPSKLAENYDQKVISIDFESGLKEGDTFYWDRTRAHWIVYLQQHTEEAYFRATIRRCDYQWENYWVYVRGPLESTIDQNNQHQIVYNNLNYDILLYITKDEYTLSKFKRHAKVRFDGHNWTVAAVNRYAQGGIMQVYLNEEADNPFEDLSERVEVTPDFDLDAPHIEGPATVQPYAANISYSCIGAFNGKFVVNSKKVEITKQDDNSCSIKVLTGKSGEFVIDYVDQNNNKLVDSLIVQIEAF